MSETASPAVPQRPPLPAVTRCDVAAWLLAAGALFLILWLHLVAAFMAGLLVHQLTHLMAPWLQRHISGERGKVFAVAFLAALIVGALVAATFGLVAFFRSDAGSLTALFAKMAEILEDSRASLPASIVEHLPANAEALKNGLVHFLREHAGDLQLVGKEAARVLAQVLIGLVIGAMVALYDARPIGEYKPLARALMARTTRLAESFRRIVFAQVRISAVNTTFTAIYVAVVLPLLGVHLPLAKTMIVVTFVAGLLPVIGNLISNTVIVVVSLAHSPQVAAASLLFLVVIHKLEYFLNARIVGSQIQARAWELLLAMLVMEAAFHIPGVVAAPVFYAYLKNELAARDLI